MQTRKSLSLIVGTLIVARLAIGIWASRLQAYSADLQKVFEKKANLTLSIGIDALGALLSMITVLLLFEYVKKYSSLLALVMLAFSAVAFGKTMVELSILDSLMALAGEYARHKTPALEAAALLATAQLDSLHFWGLLIHVFTFLPLYLFLYHTRSIPFAISLLSFIAMALVFGNTLYQMFVGPSSLWFYLPNLLLQISLSAWLLLKGFNENKYFEK